MGRAPCCDDLRVKKGPWTPDEDQLLVDYMQKNGLAKCWRKVPKLAGLNRCGKSCRLRWTNYLHPDIKRGFFTKEEETLIIQLHSVLGNKWSSIATRLPGRTDNEIKNHWNTNLRKRLLQAGIDPVTHLSFADHHSLLAASDLAPLGFLATTGLSNQHVQSSPAQVVLPNHQQYLQGQLVSGSLGSDQSTAMLTTSTGTQLGFTSLQQGFNIPPTICVDGLISRNRSTDVKNGVRVLGESNGTPPEEIESSGAPKCGMFNGLENILEGISTGDLGWKDLLEWSSIATRLPGRTNNEIKNHGNTHLRKRLLGASINPVTHLSFSDHHSLLAASDLAPLGFLADGGLSNQHVQSSPAQVPPNHQPRYLQGRHVSGSLGSQSMAMSTTSTGTQLGIKKPSAICMDGLISRDRSTDVMNGVRVPSESNGTPPEEIRPNFPKCGTSTDASVSSLEYCGTFDGLENILEGISTDDLGWKDLQLEQFSLLD